MATKTRKTKPCRDETMAVRAAKLLKMARAAFDEAASWTEFSNAVYGVGSPYGKLFPTEAERERFEQTEEHRQIEEMLKQLQDKEPPEPPARFVLRLPRSLYEALKAEAQAEGMSINTLCLAKLGTQLRNVLKR